VREDVEIPSPIPYLSRPPTPDTTPQERPIIAEPKLGPVVCQSVVAPEITPNKLVAPRSIGPITGGAESECHHVGVFGVGARTFGLDVNETLGLASGVVRS